jgi:hypothetical protein
VRVGDEGDHLAPRETLDLADELLAHRVLEGAAGFFDDGAALQLDHRLLDIGVDTGHDHGEQIPTEQLGLGADRGVDASLHSIRH